MFSFSGNYPKRIGRRIGQSILLALATVLLTHARSSLAQEKAPSTPLLALKANVDINKVSILDAGRTGKRLVAVGERSLIFVSDDEGRTWIPRPVEGEKVLTGLATSDGKKLIATGHSGVILWSGDGGDRWERSNVPKSQKEALLGVIAFPDGKAFAFGGYASFLVSSDAGKTWEQRSILGPEIDKHFYGLAHNDQSIVLVGEAGLISISEDLGEHWRVVSSPYPGSLFGVTYMPQGGYVAYGMRGKVMRSIDRGATWMELESNVTSPFFSATLLSDGRLVLAGKDGVLALVAPDGSKIETRHTADRRTVSRVIEGSGQEWLLLGDAGIRRVRWNELGK